MVFVCCSAGIGRTGTLLTIDTCMKHIERGLEVNVWLKSAFSQSKEISSDLCCFYGSGVSHNEDIMHSFQKFIVVSFPTTLPL